MTDYRVVQLENGRYSIQYRMAPFWCRTDISYETKEFAIAICDSLNAPNPAKSRVMRVVHP